MELVSLAKEVFQNAAEHAASYRLGQTALRHLDRTLWVVEKCARWAVPPPLDQDERPQPELVRPLPWVFFLIMLVTLRIARETISLLNLVMGKPPLRSADVVMYIQSKRRYLRTLKYQGNRLMRARTSTSAPSPGESWTRALHSLFEFTMCFRRQSPHYGNNNTTRLSNNDEVLVVKRSKRREPAAPGASTTETTMERLIEKMMVDLDADSDEDSSFTLTNVTSPKSDHSDFTVDSDQDAVFHNNISKIANDNETNSNEQSTNTAETAPEDTYTNMSEVPTSTPEKSTQPTTEIYPTLPEENSKMDSKTSHEATPSKIPRTPNKEQKIGTKLKIWSSMLKKKFSKRKHHSLSANGRTVKSVPSKKKGSTVIEKTDRRSSEHVGMAVSGHNTM